jgi:hypothetical protein
MTAPNFHRRRSGGGEWNLLSAKASSFMNMASSWHARLVPKIFAVASFAMLGGCIDSGAPLLGDGEPLIGQNPRLRFYTLRDGTVREPSAETFRWRDGRYVPAGGSAKDIGAFSLHGFAGADLIVQSLRTGKPVEYGIARKLADGTYLLIAIDETDADQATRDKYCDTTNGHACRVTTREAVLALARATAAKPHDGGGLALLMGH